MERFLNFGYYLSPIPDPNFQHTKLTLAVGLLLIIAAIALSIYRKKHLKNDVLRKMLRPYPGLLQTYGILILFLLLVRETGIPYLSMRLWWVVLALFFLYSLFKFILTFKSEYNKRSHRSERNANVNKYLPKRKK